MHYRASWRYTSGFGVCVMIIGICFVSAGIFFHEAILMAIGLGPFLYLWMIGQRLDIELLSDRIVYQGWFKKAEVRFDEVLSVKRAMDFAWPRNRLYGPLTYEIRTSGSCFLINLIYFGPEFSRKFQDLFPRRKSILPKRPFPIPKEAGHGLPGPPPFQHHGL